MRNGLSGVRPVIDPQVESPDGGVFSLQPIRDPLRKPLDGGPLLAGHFPERSDMPARQDQRVAVGDGVQITDGQAGSILGDNPLGR